jgi:hypothetical protein
MSPIPIILSLISSRISISGSNSLITIDIAKYSLSVEDNAISPCNFDAQMMGDPANITT